MTSGVLTIADVDQGQSNFAVQAGPTDSNIRGSSVPAVDRCSSHSADNTQTAIQQLGAGQSITASFTAVSSDGTASQLVTVTIHGTNDVPVIGGAATGAVTEDIAVNLSGNLTTGGALTIADVDQGQSSFTAQPGTAGNYRPFRHDAAGPWTHNPPDNHAESQQPRP